MGELVEAKRVLRGALRGRRGAMGDVARGAASLSIAESVLERVGATAEAVGGAVFCYVGVRDEVKTRPLLERWLAAGVEVWVPRVEGDGAMSAVRLGAMCELGVGEGEGAARLPTNVCGAAMGGVPAWVVLPCVGVTRDGRRLGQGGGYYDRYLAGLAGRSEGGAGVRTVALAFECQVVDELPTEGHDARVGAVCTEAGWVDCAAK
ncbi:MAG: 5-formyltetrahydrofolate cyclo-ligase [Planctomycetota bacterium]